MTIAIQSYQSRLDDASSRKFGTFSYLPEMDASALRKQVSHILAKGWQCAVEHVEPARSKENYWYMWKLPFFGEQEVDSIMKELTACRNANKTHHVRVVGYDQKRQTRGQCIVVFRAET